MNTTLNNEATLYTDAFNDLIRDLHNIISWSDIDIEYQASNDNSWWLVIEDCYVEIGTGTDIAIIKDKLAAMIDGYTTLNSTIRRVKAELKEEYDACGNK